MEFVRVGKMLDKYTGISRKVVVPNDVEIISAYAFQHNSYIEEVIIPDSVTIIEKCAFNDCDNLKYVTLPDSLVKIGENAFSKCSSLASIDIPASVKKIGTYAFDECSKLTTINCAADVLDFGIPFSLHNPTKNKEKFYDKDGYFYLGGTLFDYKGNSKNIIIPKSVKKICSNVSFGKSVESVDIADGVEFSCNTFVLCEKLANENGYIVINGCLCRYCGTETKLTLPSGVKKVLQVLRSRDENTVSITIPEGVEEICDEAFSYSFALEEVVLPSSLKYIGERAFKNCVNLKNINIPEGVKIAPTAFGGCKSLADESGLVIFGSTVYAYTGTNETVLIPEGVTAIACEAFHHSKQLKEVKLPSTLKTIGNDAFCSCSDLERVEFPDGITSIGEKAFYGCVLKTVILPNSVTELGSWAFYENKYLSEIKLSDSLTCINEFTFINCSALTGIVVPKSVCYVAEYAFNACTAERFTFENKNCLIHFNAIDIFYNRFSPKTLTANHILIKYRGNCKEYTIPSEITVIAPEAFDGSRLDTLGLESVIIPEGVLRIESQAFMSCKNITEINIPATVEYIGFRAFFDCFKLEAVNVSPDNKYYSSVNGILFNKAGDEIIFAPPRARITKYEIPAQVKKIAPCAFESCKNLTDITIHDGVSFIGDQAFYKLVNQFKNIDISTTAGSEYIGNDIFADPMSRSALVYPKLPLHIIDKLPLRLRLAAGYCLNPHEYSGEYAEIYKKYVISNRNNLTKFATKNKITCVADFFARLDAENPEDEKTKSEKYKNMSNLQRVLELENAVLTNEIENVKYVIDNCKKYHKQPFEFTARALCLACETGSLELVKLLLANGATFEFEYAPSLKAKYDCACATVNSIYIAQYCLILADTGSNRNQKYFFGNLPKSKRHKNKPQKRAEILDYLLTEKIPCGLNIENLLYYAIQWFNKPVVDCLLKHNSDIGEHNKELLTHNYEWMYPFIDASADDCYYAVSNYIQCLKGYDSRLYITNLAFREQNSAFYSPDVLKLVFENCDTSKLNKKKLLENVIASDNVEALAFLAEQGCIKTPKIRDALIQKVSDNGNHNVLAWLLEYKNRTADFAAEAAAAEKKLMRELNENPNSVTALKRIWSYDKLEDGTLEITSYKGNDTDVVIPEVIGKSKVSKIGVHAFSDYHPSERICAARKAIESIVIPSGVTKIGNSAFMGCENLKSIVIPSGVTEIGNSAFDGCENLESVFIPKSVSTIRDRAFVGCRKLATVVIENANVCFGSLVFHNCAKLIDKNGCIIFFNTLLYVQPTNEVIVVPENVTAIEKNALDFHYSRVKKLHIPASVERIGIDYIPPYYILTVYVKKDSFAHRFLKERFPRIPLIIEEN